MKVPVAKNKEYIVDVIDNGFEGEGIAKVDNFTIFIPGAIKGEKVKILVIKVLSSHAYGKIIEIIKRSKHRVESDCTTYKRCGGCTLRHIEYQETLNIKQRNVQNLVKKSKNKDIEVLDTIGMGIPYQYRNKAQYPLGINKKGQAEIGVYASRSHEIIPMDNCAIQHKISEQIAKFIYYFIKDNNISIYNEITKKGIFRHVVVKLGVQTDEIMCILVINSKDFPREDELVTMLIREFPKIKTIVKNINMKDTNVILGKENINLYGNGYITDILGEYKFKISPMSFYQVNPIQTELLYNKAIEMSGLPENKMHTALDLYCGIGTIGIFLSKYVDKVYGIEIVPEAIEDAKENAKINNIDNIEFMVGDVEYALSELIENRHINPDIVFVDPPRKGLDKNTIDNLLKIKPKKIVYISCNPSTLVRDINLLSEKYCTNKIQPIDCFPYTSHVECCSVLYLKDSTQ